LTPDELIDRIESAGDARRLLRARKGETGLNAAFFGRLLALYAQDPARAARLAGHWRAFLDYGDDPALAYRAKGAADRLAGRWLASAQAFVQAGERATDEATRLAYPIGAIDGYAKAGRVDEAVKLGKRLAQRLDRLGEDVLAARARLNTANALVQADRTLEARALYAKAIPVFQAHGHTTEEASSRMGLSATHLYGGDPAVCEAEARTAVSLAEEAGLDHLATLSAINAAHAAIVQGRADEAFAALLELRPRLDGSPADLARTDLTIGDACLRLNLMAEAGEAYAAALGERKALNPVDRAYARFGLAEAHADSAPDAAERHLTHAASRWHGLGNHPWRSAALASRTSLRPARRGAIALADQALAAAKGSPYHEVLALLARAEAQLARRLDPTADLRRAERLVRRYGYRRFAWRIHALRARATNRPLPHHRRMMAEILRERLAVTSVVARASFLRDKSQALGSYLSHLLADPTPARVAEAREAIRRTRAATLLDEIVKGVSLDLDPERARRLEALRSEVARDAQDEPVPDARNRVIAYPRRREWTEATHTLNALDAVVPPAATEGIVTFVEAGEGLWALVDNRAIRLGMSTSELEESLRWLRFELQTPTADRCAPSDEAFALLRGLSTALVAPWIGAMGGRPLRLCPDGLLWRVPWDALIGAHEAATLLLHPSLSGIRKVGTLDRVAVWIDAAADLPNAIAEELMVLGRFPNAMIMRTRKEIMDSLVESWDLVHVVGHARHNSGNPMFSALDFPDGPLYASEIARSGLQTRLACLSACETGTLSLATREEPDGLVRAFLARGAEAALASLWPLDDKAASRFFSALYRQMSPDTDLAVAVQAARQSVRDWREHPYFWASLSLFGGYRS